MTWNWWGDPSTALRTGRHPTSSNTRIKNRVSRIFAGLFCDFIDVIAGTAAVGDFYADRIARFGLCDTCIVYLH